MHSERAQLILFVMAKGSKKGACSANVQAAKANCLEHDRREGKVPSYVNPHLTHTNRVVFEDELIRDRKSILPLKRQREKLYEEKVKQKCQKSFAPFREDVLHIKAGITDEQLMAFKTKAEELTGWRVIGIYLHQDEGHVHSKYIEGDEDFEINYHAHVLYDCQDLQTGKAIRLGRQYFRLRQDVLAECTGMERGNPASETGRNHRSALQQRIYSQEERIATLERLAKKRDEDHKAEMKRMAEEKEKAVEEAKAEARREAAAIISQAKTQHDNIVEAAADDARATATAIVDAAKEEADKIKPSEAIKGIFGQSAKDKAIKERDATIETLQGQINDLRARNKKEVDKHSTELANVRQNAQKEVKKAKDDAAKKQETIDKLLSIPFLKAIIDTTQRVASTLGHEFKGDDRALIARAIEGKTHAEEKSNAWSLWSVVSEYIHEYTHFISETKAKFIAIADDRWTQQRDRDLDQSQGMKI